MRIIIIALSLFWISGTISSESLEFEYSDGRYKNPFLDSAKQFIDSASVSGDDILLSIEMKVEYNFISLDKIIVHESNSQTTNTQDRVTYPLGSMISLTPRDSSIEAMYIKFDKGAERFYYKPVKLLQRGNRTLRIIGRDQNGDKFISEPVFINVVAE